MIHYHSINTKSLSEKEQRRLEEKGEAKTKVFGKIRLLRNDEPKNPEGTLKGYINIVVL